MRIRTRTRSSWLAVTIAFTAGCGPASPAREVSPATAAAASSVSVVGCLMPLDNGAWGPATTGSTPPTESVKSKPSVVLKDAAVWTDKADPEGPVRIRSEREFRLLVADSTARDHVKHQVLIKGRLLGDGGAAPGAQGGTGTEPKPAQPVTGDPLRADTIEVSSIRSLANDCSADASS
jgi:hypothetical protein